MSNAKLFAILGGLATLIIVVTAIVNVVQQRQIKKQNQIIIEELTKTS